MKVYYVGSLFENRMHNYPIFEQKLERSDFALSKLSFVNLKLCREDYNYLKSKLTEYRSTNKSINNNRLIEILNKIDPFYPVQRAFSTVYYEIIESENGTKYGKEILTGLLFPLDLNPQIKYYYGYGEEWNLVKEKTYTDDNIARFRYILSVDGVASINDIEKYKSQSEKNKLDLIKNITYYYKENVFNKQIIIKETEPLIEQNVLTKLMEEIEYLLQLLKQYNVDIYNKLSLEYKNLLNNSNDTLVATDPSKKELKIFLANVKLAILVNENKKESLSKYLTDAAVKYFNKLNSNELNNTDLNINDIDILSEMFLMNKDNYTAIEQRHILTELSMLYLFITKANINNIKIEDLKESYFSKNLKTIIIAIFELQEINIITSHINITSNNNITVESVIEIIKSIEFRKETIDNIQKVLK